MILIASPSMKTSSRCAPRINLRGSYLRAGASILIRWLQTTKDSFCLVGLPIQAQPSTLVTTTTSTEMVLAVFLTDLNPVFVVTAERSLSRCLTCSARASEGEEKGAKSKEQRAKSKGQSALLFALSLRPLLFVRVICGCTAPVLNCPICLSPEPWRRRHSCS